MRRTRASAGLLSFQEHFRSMRTPGGDAGNRAVPLLTAFWPEPEHGNVRARDGFPPVENAAAARWEIHCLFTAVSLQARNAALKHTHTGEPRCMRSRFAVLAKPRKDVQTNEAKEGDSLR